MYMKNHAYQKMMLRKTIDLLVLIKACWIKEKPVSKVHKGNPWPLGSSITNRGDNFSVLASGAIHLELLIFDDANSIKPKEVIVLDDKNKSGDYWHVEVEELSTGCFYGYRVFNKVSPLGIGTEESKVLLDPCARAIAGWDIYKRSNYLCRFLYNQLSCPCCKYS